MGFCRGIVSKLVSGHNNNNNQNNGTDEHFIRLMNSALEERHVRQGWSYDEPKADDGSFFKVNFTQGKNKSRSTWPSDYYFQSVQSRRPFNTANVAVHADLANLARRYDIHINELHNFMRFPPVRAVIRTLLIELEHPDAQSGPQLDELKVFDSVDQIVSNTDAADRRTYLTQVTAPGAQFADRALVLCLVKLCAQFEGWNRWVFGSRRSTIQVFMAVVGLFCNAWVQAPTINASWSRSDTPSPPSFLSSKRFGIICDSSSSSSSSPSSSSPRSSLTPEIWFEWSLLFDPWVRQTNAIQLLNPDPLPSPSSYPDNTTTTSAQSARRTKPVAVTEVSLPEPEKQGRVVVKYDKKPDEERWAFRSILDSRWAGRTPRTGLQYLVDWQYAEPTWQPARDLQGCDLWVLEFHRENPGKAGPVPRLRQSLE
ncbi:hypothetical protein CORC01_11329 [Colletotrichum orchidophilum]|uniref:Chromo domain-containing protein n=1 Tax=Colletotrichum orchidophilum TaxID=1209926 RepID=A0A1G4AW38_9PEZI|nr:uncharacterized protein CORC01_11329 [Colletotrichum orchidophilum]OHE93379.1 hypothetical protein CORC01_11329 [Colletotrichum orchidophilum]